VTYIHFLSKLKYEAFSSTLITAATKIVQFGYNNNTSTITAATVLTTTVKETLLSVLNVFDLLIAQVKYSEELDIPADKASHFYMFLGISSGAARLLIGRLCDVKWVNIRYVNQLGITLAGLATLLLPLAKNYVSVALYTAMFGFSDGAFVTSQNVILLGIVGPDRRDAAFGFGCMLYSFVVAGGPPFAGEC